MSDTELDDLVTINDVVLNKKETTLHNPPVDNSNSRKQSKSVSQVRLENRNNAYSEYLVTETKDDNFIDQNINTSSLGPGIILKNARKEARLSQEDIAKELRLAARHIEYIEQDAYYKFTALAFYIGYVRNYARILNLDSDKLISKFYAVYKVNPEFSSIAKNSVLTHNNISLDWYKFKNTSVVKFVVNLLSDHNSEVPKLSAKKIILLMLSSVLVFSLIWQAFFSNSNSHHVANTTNDPVNYNNQEIQNLPPEKVDELLPSTGPVIAQAKQPVKKVSMLEQQNDSYS